MRVIHIDDPVTFAVVCAELTRQGIAFEAWCPDHNKSGSFRLELTGY